MILESKVGNKVVLVDCEASGGINKGDVSGNYDPDRVLESATDLVTAVAAQLAPIAATLGVAEAEVSFGVKMTNVGLVYIATSPASAQLQIRLKLREV